MRKIGLFPFFLALFCSFTTVNGQLPFGVAPHDTVRAEVQENLANEVFLYLPNQSQDSIQLKWRRIFQEQTPGWIIDICDYGTCYDGIPASGLMNMLGPQTEAYLKLIVQPNGLPGMANLGFRVSLESDPLLFRDVYFEITAGVSSVAQTIRTFKPPYPNPTSHLVSIETEGVVQLVNAQGIILESQLANGTCQFDLSLRETGLYFIIVHSGTDSKTFRIFKN